MVHYANCWSCHVHLCQWIKHDSISVNLIVVYVIKPNKEMMFDSVDIIFAFKDSGSLIRYLGWEFVL